jgi:hypothetical protein
LFPPNWSPPLRRTAQPRPAQLRLVPVSLLLVLVSLDPPQALQPLQLNWTTTHRREHELVSITFAVLVGRAEWVTNRAINLGEMLGGGLIWCLPLGSAGHCPVRPVCKLAGASPRSPSSRTWRGKGIETEGPPCKLLVTQSNRNRTHLQLAKTPRAFLQSFHRGRGRAPCSLCCWAAWTGFGPTLLHLFSFLFLFNFRN